MPAYSIIVPLHNEQSNVAALQKEIFCVLGDADFELIFVDDGSTDSTIEHIEKNPRVRIISLGINQGQSAAMLAGVCEACSPIVVFLDGDLQNDPADIPRLIEHLDAGTADCVCGWRINRQDSLSKKISSRIANTIRSRFLADGIHDTGCSLKAIRSECFAAIPSFPGVHRFLPAFIKAAGFRIIEVPVNHRPRLSGKSNYGILRRALQATRDMLAVRRRLRNVAKQ